MNGEMEKVLLIVERLNNIVGVINQRVNDLEVKLDNLRAEYNNHDHPYKPEPRYGGGGGV